MKKVAVIVDSFSGRSKNEVEKLGLEHLAQSIILDGQKFDDGIDIELKNDKEKIAKAKDIKTSMPPLGLIFDKFNQLSPNYENVIFLPMNKGMSGTYSTSFAAARDFKNVSVVDNIFCGSAIIDVAKFTKAQLEKGKSLKDTLEQVEKFSKASFTIVIPRDVAGLIKSGRLTGVKKIILEKAKLIPILLVTPNGFAVSGIKRSFERGIAFSIEKMLTTIKNKNDYNFEIIHCGDESSINIAKAALENVGISEYAINWANTPIAGHAGLGAVSFNAWPKIDVK